MPLNAPFQLGPFSVDLEGRLVPVDPSKVLAFRFRWHNRAVHARLTHADAKGGRLLLQVALARIRSTASTLDETLRPRSFALLRWLARAVPQGWRVSLLADHRVWLETDRCIDVPITAVGLVTTLTGFALELAPILELLDQVGLTVSESGTN
jgi:hypothetical protein